MTLKQDNFSNAHRYGMLDIVLADLGYNMVQLKDSQLGISYSGEGDLNMRYDRNPEKITAF